MKRYLIILCLITLSGCTFHALEDKTYAENDIVKDDELIVDVHEESVSLDACEDIISNIIIGGKDGYEISYNTEQEVFVINNILVNVINEVECPYFWIDDLEYNLEEIENVYYDEKLKLLEICLTLDDKYLSFYFNIDNGEISFCDYEEYDEFRDFPYRGKKYIINAELSENEFEDRVDRILDIYNISEEQLVWDVKNELYDNEIMKVYYNVQNDRYLVFYALKRLDTGFSFYYSECELKPTYDMYKIDDPFSLTAEDGSTGEEYIHEPIEGFQYDGERLISYTLSGVNDSGKINFEGGEEQEFILLDFKYLYDDSGELIYWSKQQSAFIWGSSGMIREYYCTNPGICSSAVYTVSHGEYDIYYMYIENEVEPEYLVVFDAHGDYLQIFEY